jgi:DUF3047 family protein
MRLRVFCAVVSVLTITMAGYAANRIIVGDFSAKVDAHGVPEGWELKERSGRADFSVRDVDGVSALHLRSTNTSFCLQRQIKADVKQYPILSWKWKVTRLPEGGDFRRTRTDDQAAQLFVAFSKWQAIVYIWDTSAPEGFMGDAPSPPFMSIKVVVVRSKSGQVGKWLTETRNIYEDYRKFFGENNKTPVASGLRLQINTQHTRTSAESYFAEVMFKQEGETRSARLATEDASNPPPSSSLD